MRVEGIVRVSRVKGREGDSFVSPREQAERITSWCESQGAHLNRIHEELDVSGGATLERRPGLSRALEAVEAGRADVIAVAYFDRLFRSLKVQAEVVERTEAAGGRVATLDMGDVSHKTAGSWLQGTVTGAFAEYYRRSVGERMAKAQADAIGRGVATWDVNIPGYRKGPDGVLVPDDLAPVTAAAFRMRRDGATIREVREFLRSHDIDRSYHGVSCLLRSRVVIGELHFGQHSNLAAHEPIVDRDVWAAVQNMKVPRGRKPRSDRLLARLGVLRCGTCGARMVVATNNHSRYWVYRCPPTGDCSRRQAISATIVEKVVADRVREVIAGEEGHADVAGRGREVRAGLERAQADLDAAIRVFDGFHEVAAVERLRELQAVRDEWRAKVDHLGGEVLPGFTVTGGDWDRLTLGERRGLVRATVERVVVGSGRGAGRVTVVLFE